MKEFDIEKLKRENVFMEPEGFFEDMQNNVLQKVLPVSRKKIINLNWAYGAAAAIALLVGVNIVINSESKPNNQLITKTVPVGDHSTNYTLSDAKPQKEEAIALKVLENDLSSLSEVHQKSKGSSTASPVGFANQKAKKVIPNPESQVDQIIASFSSAELAVVGKNSEQDIYLDLYN